MGEISGVLLLSLAAMLSRQAAEQELAAQH